ncbi:MULTISPECIES: VOC family protein [unclassified Streptomyces]|uniref:VOC family protein n=1 Tax=unclassified Streptomyces TaxID=2593676 RepID=UPI0006FACACC|nr:MULTISPECIES: VOC family protein [unclassified Streptomyces]KQX50899.1 glyoxalase [Streptomyces sp. Root1304]KRA85065.1 glyoxalase [Streptomyces sp. Root66D1]
MIGRLRCLVLDCPDAEELAWFYGQLVGGRIDSPDPRWAVGEGSVVLRGEGGPVLAFQSVADHRPPVWGAPEQQFLLDVLVDDLAVAHESVLALGAIPLDGGGGDPARRVYADPAGHPFRLVRL